jgi:tetratricopeptide (TPR) repeat protein
VAINRDKVLEAAQKHVEKKKYDRAILEYQKLTQADPNDARTLLKIGDLQAKLGTYAEAISTYESVGKLYAQQGFALKAIAVYKQIRELIAKHVPQLEERYGHIAPKLAELYQQLGLTSDALAALDEVATRLQRQQRDAEAIEVFRRIVELDPPNPLPHLRLAEALSRAQDFEGAVYEFKTAAQQLAGIGRRDDALKVLERLLHHKSDPEQAKLAAELYLARGQPQDGMQALSKLQICFQANPRDFDTLSLLARAFTTIGQGGKAIEVQKEMARVARDAGKQDLFREIVERLMRVAPQDEGVRKLASQTGSVAAVSRPGPVPRTSPMAQTAGPGGMSGSYGAAQQAPPPRYEPPASPPYAAQALQPQGPQAYGSGGNFGAPAPQPHRPGGAALGTQPIQRPITGGALVPPGRVQPSYPPIEPELELDPDDAEEIGYEEVDADEVVDVVADDARGASGGPPAYTLGAPDGDGDVSDGEEYLDADDDVAADAGDASGSQPDPEAAAGDFTEQVQKILADANAFRRVRLYAKALETLRAGLALDSHSMDLHEAYRDVLIESGQTDEAIEEMLSIASLYVDALDGDSAARALQDVLAFDPQNTRAIEMLQELGYEVVDEGQGQDEEAPDPDVTDSQLRAPNAPLPSYELEEVRPADIGTPYGDNRRVHRDAGAGDDALPSFPLDEPESQSRYAKTEAPAAAPSAVYGTPNDFDDNDPYETAPGVAQQVIGPVSTSGGAVAQELEDALDEAEFFCSRGLFDDARAIISDQLAKHPNHPLLRERLGDIDDQQQARGSGARERPREEPDRAFDIATSLDALENLDEQFVPAEGHAEGEQVDVEEVFAKFKEGVEKQISVDDSDSHYNLGIAYKEMMLLDDAIREFEVAARDPKRECVCRSMIGMVQIERGNVNEAIDAFIAGLEAPIKDPQQETVLCYEIGAAYEAKKVVKEALSYYQKAMRRDPNYRDVQERVRRLAKSEPKAPLKAAAGADDEFDRAFDDLLSKA